MKFKFIKAALAGLVLSASGLANSAVVLLVDLTVENQVTITATSGASLATSSGSDNTGFSLLGFFDASSPAAFETLLSGNLTSANNTSDNAPEIFSTNSPFTGLNIWNFTADPLMTFTTGLVAFSGQATWNIDALSYASALNGALSGNVLAPFDGGVTNANPELIGTWEVVSAKEVSAPSIFAIFALGVFGLAARRSKK